MVVGTWVVGHEYSDENDFYFVSQTPILCTENVLSAVGKIFCKRTTGMTNVEGMGLM